MKLSGKSWTALLTGSAAFFISAEALAQDSGFKSLTEIEAALNPLEVVANHGGVRRSIDLNIQFELNSANLTKSAEQQITALAGALNSSALSQCYILLTGHTDATGSAASNLSLSQVRAESVKATLVMDYGVNLDKVIADGKGESELIEGLAPDDARHRRVEVSLEDPQACKQKAAAANEKQESPGEMKIDW